MKEKRTRVSLGSTKYTDFDDKQGIEEGKRTLFLTFLGVGLDSAQSYLQMLFNNMGTNDIIRRILVPLCVDGCRDEKIEHGFGGQRSGQRAILVTQGKINAIITCS